MIIQEIKDKNIWENFVGSCFERTFLHSWNWGEFNQLMGHKIWRLGIYENKKPVGAALIVKVKAKRGIFLLCPHGPVFKTDKLQMEKSKLMAMRILLDKLKKIAKEERIDFIRIAPVFAKTLENINIFQRLKFRNAPIHVHPEITWELDIRLSEKDLLYNMRKTTRYLINKAKRDGVEISQGQNLEDVKSFYELYQKTVDRHDFVPFSLKYLKNEFEAFLRDNQVSLFFARYQGELIASAMVIFWQERAFYHQGASSQKYPKIPASYLLQWEAINEAKKRGCQIYNFWGIAPPNSKTNHRFMGVTLFKTGFGGAMKELVKTQDFPISPIYWLNFFIEILRSRVRHLS